MFVRAGPFWAFTLNVLGVWAITMPWGRVYILGDWFYHMDVRFHEWAHLEQIKREGALLFSARYLWLTIRHGYWNAYELEALDFERRSIAELRKLNGTLAYAA